MQEKSGVGNPAIEKPAVWPKIDNQEAAQEAAQENGSGSGFERDVSCNAYSTVSLVYLRACRSLPASKCA